MAEGESVSNWPPSVTFSEDDPEVGYASIYLGIPGLKVDKGGLFRKQQTNVAVKHNFENNVIEARISFPEAGNNTVFEYKKKAPASGINPRKCEILFSSTGTGRVVIKLKKVKNESWAREKHYLTSEPEEKLNN